MEIDKVLHACTLTDYELQFTLSHTHTHTHTHTHRHTGTHAHLFFDQRHQGDVAGAAAATQHRGAECSDLAVRVVGPEDFEEYLDAALGAQDFNRTRFLIR